MPRHSLSLPPLAAPRTTRTPSPPPPPLLLQVVLDHVSCASKPQPVNLASSFCSSEDEQRRAPGAEQNAFALAKLKRPLQPPKPRSLFPHTLVLPKAAALLHPNSWQDEAEVVTVGSSVGCGELGS